MKILIDGHSYSDKSRFKEICGNFDIIRDDRISGIGYFFNPAINDCVICLPKIIKDADGSTVFGGLHPENLIDVFSTNSSNKLSSTQKEFVQNFSLWSYRTISMFQQLNPESDTIYSSLSSKDGSATSGTLLDAIFAIIRFYNQNKDYFMYTIKNLHSGCNRINWRKTVSRKTPVIQGNVPIYIDVINRKKQIDFDEELMVIFYSILNYISKNFGIEVTIECNYDIISGGQFETYLDGLGIKRLNAIKYKYFSDKDIQLWALCYSFFEKTSHIQASEMIDDYLLVSDFNQVFESMVETLISDNDLPKILRYQEDGKIVDHLFRHKSPIDGKTIYYIGDSKYYSIGREIEEKSIYKQFTYAKNIIQYHFINNKNKQLEDINYRDKLTEGYNFTPNFFISAYVPSELNYDSTELKVRATDEQKHRISHFCNRLFDRDTLWLKHFDVNLLFIMMLYAENDSTSQNAFKETLKQKTFEAFMTLLEEKYDFFKIIPNDCDIQNFIINNFMLLNGKIYTLSDGSLLLALEKGDTDSAPTYKEVEHHAKLKKISLKHING